MTMHNVFFKENEGFAPNQEGPRWSGLGSHPPAAHYGDPFLPSKLTTHEFNLFSGNNFSNQGSAENAAKTNLQSNVSLSQSATVEDQAHFKLGFDQPLICAQYPYGDQYYGVYSTYAAQIAGRVMLPLRTASDGGPIFVNAKQYNAIMRRRKCRAKAEMANQVLKSRKVKPYLHFSRHLHAKRRPRGNGGRFLNTKNLSTGKEEKQNPKSTGSQVSEVVQSGGVIKYSKGKKGRRSSTTNGPGSEVTSHLLTTTHEPFQIDHLSFKPFPVYDAANAATGLGFAGYLKV